MKSNSNTVLKTSSDSKGAVLTLVSGNVVSETYKSDINGKTNESVSALGQYDSLPQVRGFFFLLTAVDASVIQVPVEVRFEQGCWFYRTWDGQKGYELIEGQSIVGPVNDIFKIESFPVKMPQVSSAVPSMPESSSSEEELDDAYAIVARLEKEVQTLNHNYNNHPSSKSLHKAKARVEHLEGEVANLSQRASVAEDEYSTLLIESGHKSEHVEALLSEVSQLTNGTANLQKENGVFAKRVDDLESKLKLQSTQFKSDQLTQSTVLDSSLVIALTKVKMLLLQTQLSTESKETSNRILSLIAQLSS